MGHWKTTDTKMRGKKQTAARAGEMTQIRASEIKASEQYWWDSDARCSPGWNGYFSPFLNEDLHERCFWLCYFIPLASLGAEFLTVRLSLWGWGAFNFLFQEGNIKDEEEMAEFKRVGWVSSIKFSWLHFTVEPVHPIIWGVCPRRTVPWMQRWPEDTTSHGPTWDLNHLFSVGRSGVCGSRLFFCVFQLEI